MPQWEKKGYHGKPEVYGYYMDFCHVLEGHTGKRRGTLYPSDEPLKGKYMIQLEQYGMTPEFEEYDYCSTKWKAKRIIDDFLEEGYQNWN